MFLRLTTLRSLALTLLLPLFFLGGCATTNPRDPFEPMNRAVYKFNDGVDTVLFRPLAEGYRAVIPEFVRNSISNFFSNINDILVALNNLLQGKVVDAYADLGRVLINSTVGLGGLFDIASAAGVEKHNEDFGQTLGRWGIGGGPYLVLPLLGPSNLRDTVGRVADSRVDPLRYMHDVRWRNSLMGTRFINTRAELLDTSKILDTAALDPYEFVRDAYLQRRRNLIFDGSPPREKDEDANNANRTPSPRAESPFPRSAESDLMFSGTPWVNAEEPAPARAATSEPPPVSTPPAAPQADFALPAEPTGAGAAQVRATPPTVVRVWVPQVD